MADQDRDAVVVVYCDGPERKPHQRTAIAAYRRHGDGWAPIHRFTFDGVDHLANQLGMKYLGVQAHDRLDGLFTAATLEDALREYEGAAAGLDIDFRSQHQWRCTECGMNPAFNDPTIVQRMLDQFAAAGELCLATIERLQREATRRRRP